MTEPGLLDENRGPMHGTRITDAVNYFRHKGEPRGGVRLIRDRRPDKFRWRHAVASLTQMAGRLRGMDRFRVEEPVREVVLDVPSPILKREVILDARRNHVDLDRGEVLPIHTMGDLRRMAFLVDLPVGLIARHVRLPEDFGRPVDTAGVGIVGRAYSDMFRKRAQRLWLEVPDADGPVELTPHHRALARRAEVDADMARRWLALSKAVLAG